MSGTKPIPLHRLGCSWKLSLLLICTASVLFFAAQLDAKSAGKKHHRLTNTTSVPSNTTVISTTSTTTTTIAPSSTTTNGPSSGSTNGPGDKLCKCNVTNIVKEKVTVSETKTADDDEDDEDEKSDDKMSHHHHIHVHRKNPPLPEDLDDEFAEDVNSKVVHDDSKSEKIVKIETHAKPETVSNSTKIIKYSSKNEEKNAQKSPSDVSKDGNDDQDYDDEAEPSTTTTSKPMTSSSKSAKRKSTTTTEAPNS